MPYTAEHKQATRNRIVEAARALFNRKGYSNVTLGEIMDAAGLTHGGFYRHFASKDALFVEAVETYGNETPLDRLEAIDASSNPRRGDLARELVDAYVSPAHLQDVEGQCPMISLASDVARAQPEVRKAYQGVLENMIGVFENGARDASHEGRERALTAAALCIGGMVLARTVADEDLAEELRKATHKAASSLVDNNLEQL